jgi:hypothetical protein
VTTHMTADRPDTLALLQNQQPQLEQALNQAGLKTADDGLQFSLRDQTLSGQNQSFAEPEQRVRYAERQQRATRDPRRRSDGERRYPDLRTRRARHRPRHSHLAHVPEKWSPVFRQGHAQTRNSSGS